MYKLQHPTLAGAGLLLIALTGCASSPDVASLPSSSSSSASASPSTVSEPLSSTATTPAAHSSAQDDSSSQPDSKTSHTAQAYPADTTSASSLSVIVNKKNPLNPVTYAPNDLQAIGSVYLRAEVSQAAQQMFAAAAADGAPMFALSGYRSYETQQGTYASWVGQYGVEQADVASARPGYSEHQTGLALDIGNGGGCDLQPCFRDTAAATWAAEHAHEYGFLVRYPWMEHETTGYWYESWHLRYIGKEQARAYKESGARTLEEFYGLPAAPSY